MQADLESERLLLRRFVPADAENLFRLDSDPEVMRFLTGGVPTPRHVIDRDVLPGMLSEHDHYPELGYWAAIERASGAFVGWFSLRPSKRARDEVELGFRLVRDAWGKGLATEGSVALLTRAFGELEVRRVVATTYENNLASRRVLEKLGMRVMRRFHWTADDLAAAGTFDAASAELWEGCDVEYALDKAAWMGRKAAGAG